MEALELHALVGLNLMSSSGNRNQAYRDALASTAATVAGDEIEAHGGWFDYGQENGRKLEQSVHLRLIVASGVISLDHEFSFDGAPDARFTPWSAIHGVRAIARLAGTQTDLRNVWLETANASTIEFAGVQSTTVLTELLTAVRAHLR